MRTKTPAIGETFGRWTVVDHTVTNKYNMSQSVCRCACGAFAVIINANLREAKTTQCRSCQHAERSRSSKPLQPKRTDEATITKIRLALRSGLSPNEVGPMYGMVPSNVRLIDRGLIWNNVPWPTGTGPREGRRARSLTDEQVLEIKQRIATGERQTEIAKDYGVDAKLISAIKCGEKWLKVPWPEGYKP